MKYYIIAERSNIIIQFNNVKNNEGLKTSKRDVLDKIKKVSQYTSHHGWTSGYRWEVRKVGYL